MALDKSSNDVRPALHFYFERNFCAADIPCPADEDLVFVGNGNQPCPTTIPSKNSDMAFSDRHDCQLRSEVGAEGGLEFDRGEGIGGGFAEILAKDLASPTRDQDAVEDADE
jgi:hypothetical protein